MASDQFVYAMNNLRQRLLRTLLTMAGIAIAVATVITLTSLGLGLYEGVNEQFDALGGNKFFVMARSFSSTDSNLLNLEKKDARFVESINGVQLAYGFVFKSGEVEYDDKKTYSYVFGIPLDKYQDLAQDSFLLKVQEGRHLRSGDNGKVVLGYLYSQENGVFERPISLRDNIEINGKKFEVVGIYQELGNPSDDRNVYMTEDDIRDLFDEPDRINMIVAQVYDASTIEDVSATTFRRLRNQLNQEKGKETYFVQTADQLKESFTGVLNIIVVFMVAIGLISLLVGAINIANTMYTAVLERTQEIGTIKAIGGRNSDILKIFMIESGTIGLLGGLIGVGIAYVVALAISGVAGAAGFGIVKFYFPLWLALSGIGFALLMGGLSGILPSVQASKQKPVEALRYE